MFFGGKSRIIDFALSNALNSGIRRIGVATQYKAHSLIRHLQRGWNFFRPERNESFDILPASQRVSETDVVRRHRRRGIPEHRHHRELRARSTSSSWRATISTRWTTSRCCSSTSTQGADVTVGCIEVPRAGGDRLRRHACRRARTGSISFLEKPADPPGMPDKPDMALASMGIYVFDTRFPVRPACAATPPIPTSSRDFGKDIIPYLVQHGKAVAHRFSQSCVRDQRGSRRPIGAMSARWTPIGRRIST